MKQHCKVEEHKHIRKGSKVFVASGNDRGAIGVVLSRSEDRAIVQGINVRKKHVKKSEANPKGGIVPLERPIHISKLKLVNAEDKPVKVRVRSNSEGKRELIYTEDQKDMVLRKVKNSN